MKFGVHLCCFPHETQKRGFANNAKQYRNRPLAISLDHSAPYALSLAPCSRLKPLNDTPRPEELNQVTSLSDPYLSILGSAFVVLESEKFDAPRPSDVFALHNRYLSSSNREASLGKFDGHNRGGKHQRNHPEIGRVLVYRQGRYSRQVDTGLNVADAAIGLRRARKNKKMRTKKKRCCVLSIVEQEHKKRYTVVFFVLHSYVRVLLMAPAVTK